MSGPFGLAGARELGLGQASAAMSQGSPCAVRVQRDGVGVVHAAIEQPGHGHGPLQACAAADISVLMLAPSFMPRASAADCVRPPVQLAAQVIDQRAQVVQRRYRPEHREVRPAEIGLDAMRIQERLLVAVQVDHRVATGAIDRQHRVTAPELLQETQLALIQMTGRMLAGDELEAVADHFVQAAFRRALAHAPCGAGAPVAAARPPSRPRPSTPCSILGNGGIGGTWRRGTPRRAGRPCRGRPR